MRRFAAVVAVLLAGAGPVSAKGLLIPEDRNLPPLAMLNHKVNIQVTDQVAVTRVEQTFRNHTDRPLEATYVFPVPRGATVNRFTMWVEGKEVKGELVEAEKARQIYTSIVRRTQDPGLLEYLGNNLLRMRVFPVPARGDQKVALSYTSVAQGENGLIEYVYPLKTEGKATSTLEDFAITATIKSQHAVQNVYSPTHAVAIKRAGDREVTVVFEKQQGLLDKDFQLYYSLGDKDVGLTALAHRPIPTEQGFALLLISPKLEASQKYQVPRDVVLVLDTSGSMRQNNKIEQARRAVKYCLDSLTPIDRFALVNFATVVNKYRDGLVECSKEHLAQARRWVDDLEPTGGTAINDALLTALEYRPKEADRTFTVVFFTDGQPTIGETKPDTILRNFAEKNTANTRVFTFGVGHDVNAAMLDQLAERSRAVSTYVQPEEDIEAKVSGLYSKISHPVLANLKLQAEGQDVRLLEMYPPQLPDLFHGGQLVVCARYSGKGPAALKLTGSVGKEAREFVFETTFPDRTGDERAFTEHLWARRKVGYLLDQVRANGEKKELVEEVTALARKYGITTPYTSWLIVPDAPAPVAAGRASGAGGMPGDGRFAGGGLGGRAGGVPRGPRGAAPAAGMVPRPTAAPALEPTDRAEAPKRVADFARDVQKEGKKDGTSLEGFRARYEIDRANRELAEARSKPGADAADPKGETDAVKSLEKVIRERETYERARVYLQRSQRNEVQTGKLGVDLSLKMSELRNQSRLEETAVRQVAGRTCVEVGGVWIDRGFTEKTPALAVKAMSDAYFRILERHPQVKEVYQLGNHLVWLTPSGTALVIDTTDGKDKLSDEEIDKLFPTRK